MIPKCEQYWPERREKIKKAGHMEITWKDETPLRKDFTQQKFEIANKLQGMQMLLIIISYIDNTYASMKISSMMISKFI